MLFGWKVSLRFNNQEDRRGLGGNTAGEDVADRCSLKSAGNFADVKGRENGNVCVSGCESSEKEV